MSESGPGLPFDPIQRAGDIWAHRYGPAEAMRVATSVMRVQQILLARYDAVLRPYEITFSRYEALVLLDFSRTGSLSLKTIGERLQVHPTSVTNIIDRLVTAGLVQRRRNPDDGRGILATLTETGRTVVRKATKELMAIDFGLDALSDADRSLLFDRLRNVRSSAGDFTSSDLRFLRWVNVKGEGRVKVKGEDLTSGGVESPFC
jgi:DNA-binding MarR family transcriptional regulator